MDKQKKEVGKMISIEIVKEKISSVLNDFIQQELGNRITRFNTQGLANIMLDEISKEDNKSI
jgi:hypothetical protein